MRLSKVKVFHYFLTGFLTLGTVLSVGFLSFSGLWLIYPYLIPAILAFLLSGLIEGKVFGKSIFKGLKRLKLLGPNALRHLFIIEFERWMQISEKKGLSFFGIECDFLKDYKVQLDYCQALKKDVSKSDLDVAKLKEAKRRLEELRVYFFKQMRQGFPGVGSASYVNEKLVKQAGYMLAIAKQSVWFLRFFSVVSSILGITAGFITAFAVHEAITVGLALALSTTALAAIVWPVAIFAAIGAAFLFYYVVTDIVKEEVIEKACRDIASLFKRECNEVERESLTHYIIRLTILSLVIAFVISLTLFTTIASAGTCWFAAKKGIVLIPKIPAFVAIFTRGILVPIGFVTDLIYGFSNSFQTVVKFKGLLTPVRYIRERCQRLKQDLIALREKESLAQFFNPFRFILNIVILPFQGLIFLGHLISVGLTSDRLGNISPVFVATTCAIAEGLEDANFLVESEEAGDQEHDHDHGSFFTILLKMVLFPLILLSGFWHWAFKKEESQLTLGSAIKQGFGFSQHSHEHSSRSPILEPQLSESWREKERISYLFAAATTRLNGSVVIDRKLAKEKKDLIDKLDRQAMSNFIKEKTQSGRISTEEAVVAYLSEKPEKVKKEVDKNDFSVKNGFVQHSELESEDENSGPSAYDTLSRPRLMLNCIFFRTSSPKQTRTLDQVTEAFRLIVAEGT